MATQNKKTSTTKKTSSKKAEAATSSRSKASTTKSAAEKKSIDKGEEIKQKHSRDRGVIDNIWGIIFIVLGIFLFAAVKFNAAGKSASEIYSENGDVVGTYDELNLVYENAEGKEVYLNAFPADKELAGDEETVHGDETDINGIKVAYDETAIKVSSDGSADGETYVEVVETEDGKLVTTQAGGDENVKINEMSDICWIQDGIRYQLTSVDGVMSFEEMQEMAKEIIETK